MKHVVDFETTDEMFAVKDLLYFLEKLGVSKFNELYSLEHWFSDVMIIDHECGEYQDEDT